MISESNLDRIRTVPDAVREILGRRARQVADATSNQRHDAAYQARLVAGINARMSSELAPVRESLAVAVQGAQQAIARQSSPTTAEIMSAELSQAQEAAQIALNDADDILGQ